MCDINNTMRKERRARRFLSRSDGEEKGLMERKGRDRSEKEGKGEKRKGNERIRDTVLCRTRNFFHCTTRPARHYIIPSCHPTHSASPALTVILTLTIPLTLTLLLTLSKKSIS